MDFKKIPNEYRPIPFWSWNEKLDTEETRRQVRLMKDAHLGGYFMHARGGLLTEYMGEEWFDNVLATVEEGEACGMDSWAYDENGWPSGFGDGRVLELGEDYHIKALTYKKTEDYDGEERFVLLRRDGYTYYYQPNSLYVDLLNPDVTDAFIKVAYEPYYERYGNRITGFFTDEPQLLRVPGYPWSVVTRAEFQSRYDYDLVENIPSLFFEVGDFMRVRLDYWRMTTELFSKNYFKRLYDWCEERGYKLTGHLVMEDVLEDIIPTNGSAMAHYEYFQIPGIDWLGRPTHPDVLGPKQLGSAAAQLGKKQALAEDFAMTGHNVTHTELKKIFEWQAVRGINLLCTHLEGYSNRGIRKRDYPAAIYYQQPWWDEAPAFFDTVSRIGALLGEGEEPADTLLISPLSAAWCMYDGFVESRDSARRIRAVNNSFAAKMRRLEEKHILYHIGDETLIERHGRVEGGRLVIGNMRYSRIIIPEEAKVLFDNTKKLIDEFLAAGGAVTTVDDIPENPITSQNSLTYTMRADPDFTLHYFVNSENKTMSAVFNKGAFMLDPASGELSPFTGAHTFAPYSSLILIENGEPRAKMSVAEEPPYLSLLGEWEVVESGLNSITLDRCDFSFDGGEITDCGYVLDILPRINEKHRPVRLYQRYSFKIEEMPEGEIYLVTETPDMFEIKINSNPLPKHDAGYLADISFRKIPMKEFLRVGINTVELESTVGQRPETYRHIEKSFKFETMSNCLSYDNEIEQIYIAGDFGVHTLAECEELALDAYRVKELMLSGSHSFALTRAPERVDIARLDSSGYPQFSGKLVLKKRFDLENTHYRVKLKGNGINAIRISVNGKDLGVRMFAPYDVDISDALRVGENEIVLTILNNLRNMQGPTHLKVGECTEVGRNRFYRESNVLSHPHGADESCHDVLDFWDDGICLVHYGLTE